MNWIDKKYRENLKEEKFSESLKKKGWEDLQSQLDSEFPQKKPAGGGASNLWKYGLGAVLGLSLLGGGLWWQNERDVNTEVAYYVPRIDSEEKTEEAEYSPGSKGISNNLEGAGKSDISTTPTVIESDNQKAQGLHSEPGVKPDSEGQEYPARSDNASAIAQKSAEPNLSSQRPASRPGAAENAKEAGVADLVEKQVPSLEVQQVLFPDEVTAPDQLEVAEDNSSGEQWAENSEPQTSENISKQLKDEIKGTAIDSVSETRGVQLTEKSEPAISDEQQEPDSSSFAAYQEDPNADSISTSGNDPSEVTSSQERSSENNSHLSFPLQEMSSEEIIPGLNGRRFSLSFWTGYLYTSKLLKGGSEAYLQKRQEEEQPINTWATGVDVDYYMARNWTFSTGMHWTEYGEEVNYQFTRTDSITFDGRHDSLGRYTNIVSVDSVRIIDSINVGHWNYNIVRKYRDTAAEKYNGRTSFSFIEIPLVVGYRFGPGRLKTWVKSGVSMGIPIRTDFHYLNTSASNFTDEKLETPTPAVQWNYLLSLGVDYKLARHWSLRLNGMGSLHLNSVIENQSVQQRYYRLGGTIGFAYHF